MEVRPGRAPARADIADDLALHHPPAFLDALGDAAQMGVSGGVLAAVADADIAPVGAVPAGELHHAVAGRHERRAAGGAEIDAAVHLGVAQGRVLAVAVARGQPRPVDRRAQQSLAHAVALLGVVIGEAVRRRVAVDRQRHAAQHQRGIEHVALAHRFAGVVEEALEQHLEAVATLNLALEIDVEAEGADHLHHHRHRHARHVGGLVEARIDDPAGVHQHAFQRNLDGAGREAAVVGASGLDGPARSDPDGEALEHRHAVFGRGRERDGERLAHLELARIEQHLERRNCRLGVAWVAAGAQQGIHQGVAGAHVERLVLGVGGQRRQHDRGRRRGQGGHGQGLVEHRGKRRGGRPGDEATVVLAPGDNVGGVVQRQADGGEAGLRGARRAVEDGRHQLADLQAARIEMTAQRRDRRVGVAPGAADAQQRRGQGIALADPQRLVLGLAGQQQLGSVSGVGGDA